MCKACLKWCLRGKASKFCSSLLKTNEDLTYKQLLTRLGDRFGDIDLNAAARAKLNSATQKKDEVLKIGQTESGIWQLRLLRNCLRNF